MQTHASVLDHLELKYGPVAAIGRYTLAAERTMRDLGIRLRVTDLEEITAVNARNRDTWVSYLPIFDPQFHAADRPTLAIVGEAANGEVVATLAACLYNWHGTTFTAETEALRLMYANPAQHALEGEAWRVSACAGKGIEGNVAYSGAAWYHPNVRGCGLFETLPRVSRSLAHALWRSDCTVSISSKTLIDKGVTKRVGYTNLEMSVFATNSRIGTMTLGLVWSKTDEMLADLAHRLTMLEAGQANATNTASLPSSR